MFTIYNVDFQSKIDFFHALGYKNAISPAQINAQYNGIENLIKTRLNLVNDLDIENKLKELRNNFYSFETEKSREQKDNYPENYFILNAVYKTAFKMLSEEQQKTIIQTVATLKNLNAEELTQEISEDLKVL